MHFPVLLCGIICGPQYGLLCGILGPLLSSLLTYSPPTAYLPRMMVELIVYGLMSGVMMRLFHTGRQTFDICVSLIIAMLSGRILAGIANALLFMPGEYSLKIWAIAYFVSCFPAIIIQLFLIPILYLALQKAGLVPKR